MIKVFDLMDKSDFCPTWIDRLRYNIVVFIWVNVWFHGWKCLFSSLICQQSIDILTIAQQKLQSLSSRGASLLAEWADSWRAPCSFSLSPVGMVPLVPNLINSPLSAWQVKLPSDVSCLEQLSKCLQIQPSTTK
jgi:hypothetical protein